VKLISITQKITMSQKGLQQKLGNELKGRVALKCENKIVQELNHEGWKPSDLSPSGPPTTLINSRGLAAQNCK